MARTAAQDYLDVGRIATTAEDIYPTTGAHLDMRVLKDGQYIDPGTIRSLLTRLKVDKDRKALWQQQGEQWNPAYPITSGYGKRVAPTKDASTFHPAHDYGIGAGVPLAWEGPGTFTPGRGYGSIKTTDAQGTPYEIRLLHTVGGKQGEQTAMQQQPIQPSTPQKTQQGDTYIILPGIGETQKQGTNDFLTAYAQQLMSAETPQIKSSINPLQLLMGAFNQTPNYLA
jgi:hypothetical protein